MIYQQLKQYYNYELQEKHQSVVVAVSGGAKGGLGWAKPTLELFEPTLEFFFRS